jgi:3-hydroxyacyl-[acyl-carrier-protein] dehydratase
MTKISEGCITACHPALAGHFPGNPIVPGVLLLGEVLLAIERHFEPLVGAWSWPFVKFIAPLHPGQHFAVNLEREDRNRLAFSITREDMMVASGRLQTHGPLDTDVASGMNGVHAL